MARALPFVKEIERFVLTIVEVRRTYRALQGYENLRKFTAAASGNLTCMPLAATLDLR